MNENNKEQTKSEDSDRSNGSGAPKMDSVHPHLLLETAKYLTESKDERVRRVHEDKFIRHANAVKVLEDLQRVYHAPTDVDRPLCLAIIGASNQGKSAIIRCFREEVAIDCPLLVGADENSPLIIAQIPPRPTQGAVVGSLAREINLRGLRGPARIVTDNVMRALQGSKPTMIVFNEFQQLKALPASERQVVYDFVKGLTELKIHVVVMGTDKMRDYLIEDEQIENRFRVAKLTSMNVESKEFKQFLNSLEACYPLPKPSKLAGHYRYIYSVAKGITGEVVGLCNTAAEMAVRQGAECIELEHLKRAKPLPLASAA